MYLLTVTFNDECDDLELEFETAQEALKYQLVYETYMKNLSSDWNEWCNLETYKVIELFMETWAVDIDDEDDEAYEDYVEEFEENFEIYEYWRRSSEYPDCFAMADSTIITWYDEIGVEYHTKEIEVK
jgi:hypothetical protein